MVRKFLTGVGLVVAMAAGVDAAAAADLAARAAYTKAPAAAPAYAAEWGGFYLGINGGYGWGKASVDSAIMTANPAGIPAGATNPASIKGKGALYGGHAGYNWQYGSIVAGLEADYDAADVNGDLLVGVVPVTAKVDQLASVRTRIGYTVMPNLLLYGTAGGAWGHLRGSETYTGIAMPLATSQMGWAAGAGLEYKLWGHLMARIEYLHYDFGRQSVSLFEPGVGATAPLGLTDSYVVKTSVDAVRGGLSYKF